MGAVLIIEDDRDLSTAWARLLRGAGHQTSVAGTLADGLAAAQSAAPDVICLDVNLPDGCGLDAVGTLAAGPGHPVVLVLTADSSSEGAEQALRSGAWDYLDKSDAVAQFEEAVRRAADYHAQQQRAVLRPLDLGRMVGRSPAMRACHERLGQAAACDATVLITGESGTGKELVAWAIHANSRRREKSFVVVDCAALPAELVESMLFGHRRGSFTGAVDSRVGLVEQADGGTLFLDEVAEMPLATQKVFLRILQEKRFRPVGSEREVRSDFRLVAATNRDLEAMVEAGHFRADLLFRLRALHLELPPLRERGSDVAEIAREAVSRICAREAATAHGSEPSEKQLSPEFLSALGRHRWPGNVRELINALEQAVAAAWNQPALLPIHLPLAVRTAIARSALQSKVTPVVPPAPGPGARPTPAPVANDASPALPTLKDHRQRATQLYLEDLLRRTAGDLTEACRVAGVSRSRFYALLKEHGLVRRN